MTRAVQLLAGMLLCSLVLAAPAGAAKSKAYGLEITDARLSEVVTFHGDGGPACQRAGVCDYSGTVSYSFQHADGFAGIILHGHRATGLGSLEMGALTSATVQGPGGGVPCTDKVLTKFESFEVQGSAARPQLAFHRANEAPKFLDTYCAGPRDLDVAHLIPPLTLPARALRGRSVFAQTSATRDFHLGPFVGTLSFSAAVRMRRSRELTDLFGLFFG